MGILTHIPKQIYLIVQIKRYVKEKFFIRYAINRFSIHTSTTSDYKELIRNLDENTQYHTYTNRKNKTRVFVVRELPSDLITKNITQELQELGIEALKCNPMRGTTKPLYMIITKDNVSTKTLNQKIKFLSYTRVTL